jgi:hypothetical protein
MSDAGHIDEERINDAEERLFSAIESDTVSDEHRARVAEIRTAGLHEHFGAELDLSPELSDFEQHASESESKLDELLSSLDSTDE